MKHGYVQEMKEWTFSSFGYYLKSKGEDWLMDAFYRYPIIDYTEGDNNFSVNNIGKSIEIQQIPWLRFRFPTWEKIPAKASIPFFFGLL